MRGKGRTAGVVAAGVVAAGVVAAGVVAVGIAAACELAPRMPRLGDALRRLIVCVPVLVLVLQGYLAQGEARRARERRGEKED